MTVSSMSCQRGVLCRNNKEQLLTSSLPPQPFVFHPCSLLDHPQTVFHCLGQFCHHPPLYFLYQPSRSDHLYSGQYQMCLYLTIHFYSEHLKYIIANQKVTVLNGWLMYMLDLILPLLICCSKLSRYMYCGWLKFRVVPIFVVFVEGQIHEFQNPQNGNFLY